MNEIYLQYAVPAFLVLIFIEVLYSQLKGLCLYNLRNSLSCLACGMFTTTVEVFIKAALIVLYIWVYENFSWTTLADNSWLTWISGIFVFDFLWYWAHRWSHEVNILWGGHSPHHQSEEFNLTAGLRQGALQDLMIWPLYLSMAVLGYSAEVFVACLLINKFYGFWLHTCTIDKIPFIEGILGTPSAHRVHHGMNDQYIDKNHGGILMLFDRLFGTYQAEEEEVIYGVRTRHRNFDPVSAHFSWLLAIWRDARSANSVWDKIRIWFMPTGWKPKGVTEKTEGEAFSPASYVKFDAKPGKYPVSLVLSVFVLLVVSNQFLVLQSALMSWPSKAALAALITAGLLWLGHLLNKGYSAGLSSPETNSDLK